MQTVELEISGCLDIHEIREQAYGTGNHNQLLQELLPSSAATGSHGEK